jgi:diguanylate cyclase (GGDEF)-like protein/putative nucleotidyltransferase with HDIG domain
LDRTRERPRSASVDPAPANRAAVQRVFTLSASYMKASAAMFRAVDGHDTGLVLKLDHTVGDPAFGAMQTVVYSNAAVTSRTARARSAALRHDERAANQATGIAFGVGLCLLFVFALILDRFRRRLDGARLAEVRRLAELAFTDPLTELRNHRAFHEDLATNMHQVGRNGTPVSLVMLDLDGLKTVNDTLGHQAGDDCLRTLADAVRVTCRGSDCGYRVGGDEFAVILDNTRTWGALEYVHRLQASLTQPTETTASAGISEALVLTDKDTLIHQADLALITTKRRGHVATIYTPEMEPNITTVGAEDNSHYTQTLANALARAVDAKDSYTRSHSQTVSQLAALIATELNLDAERLARIRLAGLLHDVGKIGVPDAILTKPGKLTDDEYRRMQAHSVLGYEIVLAADLPTEATWGAPPPRAVRRARLPRRPLRQGDPARVTDHLRSRRVRGDDLRPAIPQGARGGVCASRATPPRRHAV